jgi:hypothetical protein
MSYNMLLAPFLVLQLFILHHFSALLLQYAPFCASISCRASNFSPPGKWFLVDKTPH